MNASATPAREDKRSILGKRLAGYEIRALVGSGAKGKVYAARQLSLDRNVAFKILYPALSTHREHVEAFEQEARFAACVNHPRIVQVYDVGRAGPLYYIAMELMERGSVKRLLDEKGSLADVQAVQIACDIADALAFAECRHLVHRDVKPANIFLDEDGRAKLGDLGLAKSVLEAAGDTADEIVGTPRYMSPEQAVGGDVDHRTDIYALGVSLYEMIHGAPPFSGGSPRDVICRILHDSAVPLAQAVPGIDPHLSTLVDRMLAKDPAQRIQHAAEVKTVLDDILQRLVPGDPRSAPPPGTRRLSRSSRKKRYRRNRSMIQSWLGAVFLILLLLGVLWLWRGQGKP